MLSEFDDYFRLARLCLEVEDADEPAESLFCASGKEDGGGGVPSSSEIFIFFSVIITLCSLCFFDRFHE